MCSQPAVLLLRAWTALQLHACLVACVTETGQSLVKIALESLL